jgi:CBS domain containing-hemolysin-like protein
MDLLLTIALITFFLMLEGFFSGSELLLVSLNKVKLKHLTESGKEYAKILENMLNNPDSIFGATSIGTNLCVFIGSAAATAYLYKYFENRADIYSIIIMGPITLILGEIVPKAMFRASSEKLAPIITKPLLASIKLFSPILAITSSAAQFILSVVLRQNKTNKSFISREEILILTKISEERLELDQEGLKMIDRIFEFRSSDVVSAMQPLIHVAAISEKATIAEAKFMVAETGYSRLPVFSDRIYNIIGIVSAFDILRHKNPTTSMLSIMSPAFYVPDTKKNSLLLNEMQEAGIHMAVVVDEYGGAVGVVTLEDLVEEIVGEIEDEYDQTVKSYEKLDFNRFVVDAAMEIDQINESLGLEIPTGNYETMAGFINESLERIARSRETLAIGPYLVKILEASSRKVKTVEIVDLRVNSSSNLSTDLKS